MHGSNTRISLDSYLYLKLAKTLCLSYYLLRFLFNKIREEEGGTGSARKQSQGGGGRMKVNVKIIKERKREKKEMMLSLAPTL
jgi:hypothetical protein